LEVVWRKMWGRKIGIRDWQSGQLPRPRWHSPERSPAPHDLAADEANTNHPPRSGADGRQQRTPEARNRKHGRETRSRNRNRGDRASSIGLN
jgi:hypothetical protein